MTTVQLPEESGVGLPGNLLIWILIVSEFLVFGIALVGFQVMRLLHIQEFRESTALLHPLLGTLNMAVLLTSGLLAALALDASRRGAIAKARRLLLGAAVFGIGFVVVKGFEYADLLTAGKSMNEGQFFPLYFLITGFHAAHVIAGVIVLLLLALSPQYQRVEAGVAFWHMVDLIWVLVFPVVYLMS